MTHRVVCSPNATPLPPARLPRQFLPWQQAWQLSWNLFSIASTITINIITTIKIIIITLLFPKASSKVIKCYKIPLFLVIIQFATFCHDHKTSSGWVGQLSHRRCILVAEWSQRGHISGHHFLQSLGTATISRTGSSEAKNSTVAQQRLVQLNRERQVEYTD